MRALIEGIAGLAAAAGLHEVSLGIDNAATAAIREMPGAEAKTAVYLYEKRPPHAIDSASVTIAGVRIRAQAESRLATPEEHQDGEGDGWTEHRETFASRSA